MCRWFAYLAPTEECLLEDCLVAPAHSLSKQVNDHYLPKLLSHEPSVHAEHTTNAEITKRNRLLNIDGFGMAWYTPAQSVFSSPNPGSSAPRPTVHPVLYKTIQPPLHDSNFRSICAGTSTTCVLAHIRAATSTGINSSNNHPFTFGRHTIMHNGYISDFAKISRQMAGLMNDECYEHIGGSTDTEHLAALYMSYLTAGSGEGEGVLKWENAYTTGQMLEALRQTANTIIELQRLALGNQTSPNDLNVCVTDGSQLVGMRFRNHKTEQPPSLFYSTTAGITLNRKYPDHPDGPAGPYGPGKSTTRSTNGEAKGHNPHAHRESSEHGKHIIVASEPTTYKEKEWELIEKNFAILVEADGSHRLTEVQ